MEASVLHTQLRAVIAGDAGAWAALGAALVPRITAIARSHEAMRKRGLAQSEDDVAEIQATTIERLKRRDFRNLQRYLEQAESTEIAEPQSFDSWLYGAVEFSIRDHLRKRYGRVRRAGTGDAPVEPGAIRGNKRATQSLAERFEHEPAERSIVRAVGIITQLSVAQIFAHIEGEFSSAEASALRLYYREDKSFDELAQELGLEDAHAAEKLIRRLNARLRYRFANSNG